MKFLHSDVLTFSDSLAITKLGRPIAKLWYSVTSN